MNVGVFFGFVYSDAGKKLGTYVVYIALPHLSGGFFTFAAPFEMYLFLSKCVSWWVKYPLCVMLATCLLGVSLFISYGEVFLVSVYGLGYP